MKYVIKIKMHGEWHYACESTIVQIKDIYKEGMRRYYYMPLDKAQKLMLHVIQLHKDKIEEIAIIKITDYLPYTEYETVEYREFH